MRLIQTAEEQAVEATQAVQAAQQAAEQVGFSMENSQQYLEMAKEYGIAVAGALVILIIGFWFAGFVRGRLMKLFARSDRMDETVSSFLASLAKYAIMIVTIIAVLGQFGVEATSLVAIVGAAGLAIGLALQGTLSNVAAGVMLLIFRPFKVGQFVDVAGHAGVVKGVTLFVTEMDTGDNKRIIIPNSAVWGSSIVNVSFHDTRRVDLVFGIGYADDIDKAMDVIKKTIAADDRSFSDPEPVIAVTSLGESSVDILVRVWCKSGDYWGLNWSLLKSTKEAFDKEGISIPYPCRSIYMEKGE
jgi:small conductance mechanosensitive channel